MLGVEHFVGILVKGDPKVTLTSMSVLMRVYRNSGYPFGVSNNTGYSWGVYIGVPLFWETPLSDGTTLLGLQFMGSLGIVHTASGGHIRPRRWPLAEAGCPCGG